MHRASRGRGARISTSRTRGACGANVAAVRLTGEGFKLCGFSKIPIRVCVAVARQRRRCAFCTNVYENAGTLGFQRSTTYLGVRLPRPSSPRASASGGISAAMQPPPTPRVARPARRNARSPPARRRRRRASPWPARGGGDAAWARRARRPRSARRRRRSSRVRARDERRWTVPTRVRGRARRASSESFVAPSPSRARRFRAPTLRGRARGRPRARNTRRARGFRRRRSSTGLPMRSRALVSRSPSSRSARRARRAGATSRARRSPRRPRSRMPRPALAAQVNASAARLAFRSRSVRIPFRLFEIEIVVFCSPWRVHHMGQRPRARRVPVSPATTPSSVALSVRRPRGPRRAARRRRARLGGLGNVVRARSPARSHGSGVLAIPSLCFLLCVTRPSSALTRPCMLRERRHADERPSVRIANGRNVRRGVPDRSDGESAPSASRRGSPNRRSA